MAPTGRPVKLQDLDSPSSDQPHLGPEEAAPASPPLARPTKGTIALYALVETKSGAGAWGTRVREGERVHALSIGHQRFGRSRRHVELHALRLALEDAERAGWRDVEVITSDSRGAGAVRRVLEGALATTDLEAGRLRALRTRFDRVAIRTDAFLDDPALVRTVKLALDAEIRRVAESRSRRVRSIERLMERARGVQVVRTESGFLANGRYAVTLDPAGCECPDWRRRWAQVPLAGRRRARLPCKHIVAAAALDRTITPADLEVLVRRATR